MCLLADIIPVKIVSLVANITDILDVIEFVACLWDLIANSTVQVVMISTF
jgi:hypothetical protein